MVKVKILENQEVTRIVIADDHPVVVEGLELFLNSVPWIDVVGTAYSLDVAVQMVLDLSPDVLLSDLHFPGMKWKSAVTQLAEEAPATAIIILTADRDDENLQQAIGIGVKGFLCKDIGLKRIPEAIRTVLSDQVILDRVMLMDALKAVEERSEEISSRFAKTYNLTHQELRVLYMMVEGKTNRSIAKEYSISPNTVKTHASRIFGKLGVADRTQAAIIALREGLVS